MILVDPMIDIWKVSLLTHMLNISIYYIWCIHRFISLLSLFFYGITMNLWEIKNMPTLWCISIIWSVCVNPMTLQPNEWYFNMLTQWHHHAILCQPIDTFIQWYVHPMTLQRNEWYVKSMTCSSPNDKSTQWYAYVQSIQLYVHAMLLCQLMICQHSKEHVNSIIC